MELKSDSGELTNTSAIHRALKRLRESYGPSYRKFGNYVGYSFGTLARVETGKEPMSEALAELLDQKFDPPLKFVEMLELARKSENSDYGRRLIEREKDATRLQVFTSSVVPGLLQTEEYARELYRLSMPWDTEDQTARRVADRMKRQEVFNQDKPPIHWAIIDESSLKRPVGDDACMRGQLKHLLKMSGQWRTTTQVLPFNKRGHSMMGGSANLLTKPNGITIGYVESFKTGELIEEQEKVTEILQLFDVARSKALPEDESLDLIRHYLEAEYGNECHP